MGRHGHRSRSRSRDRSPRRSKKDRRDRSRSRSRDRSDRHRHKESKHSRRSPSPSRSRRSRSRSPGHHKSKRRSPSPPKPSPLEEIERKRKQQELEAKLIEEETARRVEEAIRKRVEEVMSSDVVKEQIEARLKEERSKLEAQVTEQLDRERQALLDAARAVEDEEKRKKEELENALAENQRKLEESRRREQEEEDKRREARYKELEEEQRRRNEEKEKKRREEAQKRQEQQQILGKGKARPKLSFSLKLQGAPFDGYSAQAVVPWGPSYIVRASSRAGMETPEATLTGDGMLLVAIQHATAYLSSITSPEKMFAGGKTTAPEDVERLIALFSKGSPGSCGEVDTGAVAQVLATSLARLDRPLMLDAREAARAVAQGGEGVVDVLRDALSQVPPQRMATIDSLIRLIASLSEAISPGGGREGLDVLATTFGPLIITVDPLSGPTREGAAALTRAMVENRARLFPEVSSFSLPALPTTSVASGPGAACHAGSYPVALSQITGVSGPSASGLSNVSVSRSGDDGASCSSMDDITSNSSSQAARSRRSTRDGGGDPSSSGKRRGGAGAARKKKAPASSARSGGDGRGEGGGGRAGAGRRVLGELNPSADGARAARGKENASAPAPAAPGGSGGGGGSPPQRQLWSPRAATARRGKSPRSSPPSAPHRRPAATAYTNPPSSSQLVLSPGPAGGVMNSPAVASAGGAGGATPGSAPSRKQLEIWFHRLGGVLAGEVVQALEAQHAQQQEVAQEELRAMLQTELDRRGEELLGSLSASLERHQDASQEQMAALLTAQQAAMAEALRETAGGLQDDLARHRRELKEGLEKHEMTVVEDIGDLMIAQQADLQKQAEGVQAAVEGHAAAALAAGESVAATVEGQGAAVRAAVAEANDEVVAAVAGHTEGVAAEARAAAGEVSARLDALSAVHVAAAKGGARGGGRLEGGAAPAGPVVVARVALPPPGTDEAGALPGSVRSVAFGEAEGARPPVVPAEAREGAAAVTRKGGAGAWLLDRWRRRGVARPIILVAASALLSVLPSQGPAPATKWQKAPKRPIQIKIPARIKIPCES